MQIKTFTPENHNIKALIYGASGTGKTVFTGTAEKAIYASAEGGLLSIADKNPQFVEIKALKDLVELYSYLKTASHEYETLVIDSITEINEIIKMEIEAKAGRSMQLQDWGELSKKVRDLFRKFRDLPMNVIFVAQESYITDEDKIRKIVPSMNGKAATDIAYFMDIVGYLHVESDGTRWIETSSNKKFLTKDRSKMIGNETALDFREWLKKVAEIKTSEQVVNVTYSPTQPKAQTATGKHLLSLKQELIKRGAKDAIQALSLLNTLTGGSFASLNLPEEEASSALMRILQIPKEVQPIPVEQPEEAKKPKKKVTKKSSKKS